AVVLKPDHVRDVNVFVRRYGARAFGPYRLWRQNIPESELEGIQPGSELPCGLVALYDGRGRNETPLWLPEQRALVFADALAPPLQHELARPDDADRADGVAGAVEDRRSDAGLADHGLFLLERVAPLAGRRELLPQRRGAVQRLPGQPRQVVAQHIVANVL